MSSARSVGILTVGSDKEIFNPYNCLGGNDSDTNAVHNLQSNGDDGSKQTEGEKRAVSDEADSTDEETTQVKRK